MGEITDRRGRAGKVVAAMSSVSSARAGAGDLNLYRERARDRDVGAGNDDVGSGGVGSGGVGSVDLGIVDLGKREQDAARELDRALSETGFATLVGHGVSDELIAAMEDVCRQFFAQSDAAKRECAQEPESRFAGYCSIDGGADRGQVVELWESFEANRLDGERAARELGYPGEIAERFVVNRWPDGIGQMRVIWETYLEAMARVAFDLYRLTEIAFGVEPGTMTASLDRHWSYLAANWYPGAVAATAGQCRQIEHTDIATFTILHVAESGSEGRGAGDGGAGGLEILVQGRWQPVARVAGSFVINVGDLLERWSGGRWPATWHRVGPGRSDRMSIPYFCYPDAEWTIRPLARPAGGGRERALELDEVQADEVQVGQYAASRHTGAYRPAVPV